MGREGFTCYRSYYDVAQRLPDKDRLAFYDALFKRQFTGEETELKGMAEFAYMSQKHSIDRQVKGWEDKTKKQLSYPWQGGAVTPTEGELSTPRQQEKEKEKEKEQYSFDFKKSLLSLGFESNLVAEWLKVRKAKKLTNTETAFNKFIKQVEATGVDKNLILEKCVEKSWGGFESSWINQSTFSNVKAEDKILGVTEDGEEVTDPLVFHVYKQMGKL
jgi:hypothetical protein